MEQAIALRLQVGPAASLSGVRAAELWSLQAGCSPGKTSWAHNEFSPKLLTRGSSLRAHFTDEKIQERAGNPALMRSAGTGRVPQHPSSSSITTRQLQCAHTRNIPARPWKASKVPNTTKNEL